MNITFPTDSKLILAAIIFMMRIACFLGIRLRKTYGEEIKSMKVKINFGRRTMSPEGHDSAMDRLRNIARYLLHDLSEKLPHRLRLQIPIQNLMKTFRKAINQKRGDHNKIYCIHEPQARCIAKGKAHKKYEFGTKVSFAISKAKGIIMAALNLRNNQYDGDTAEPTINQMSSHFTGYKPETLLEIEDIKGATRLRVSGCLLPMIFSMKHAIKQRGGSRNCLVPELPSS
jgi:IS5 family transposase